MGCGGLIALLFVMSFVPFELVHCSDEVDDDFAPGIENPQYRLKRGFLTFDEISKLRDADGVLGARAGGPLSRLPTGSLGSLTDTGSVLRKAPKLPVGELGVDKVTGLVDKGYYNGPDGYDEAYYNGPDGYKEGYHDDDDYNSNPNPQPKKLPAAAPRSGAEDVVVNAAGDVHRHIAELRRTQINKGETDFKTIDELKKGGGGTPAADWVEPRAANNGLLQGDNGIKSSKFPSGIPQICQRGVRFSLPFNFKDTTDKFIGYHVVAADTQDLNTLKAFMTGNSNHVTFGDNPKIKLNVAGAKHKLTGFGTGSVVVDCSEQNIKKTESLCVTEAGDPAFTPLITHTDNESYAFIVRCYANKNISPGWFLISTKPEAVSEETLKLLKQHLKELGLDSNRIYLQEFNSGCRSRAVAAAALEQL